MNRENTNFWAILETIAERANMQLTTISTNNGWSKGYISSNKGRKSTPMINNAARMVEQCGYVLAVVPREQVTNEMLTIKWDADGDARRE